MPAGTTAPASSFPGYRTRAWRTGLRCVPSAHGEVPARPPHESSRTRCFRERMRSAVAVPIPGGKTVSRKHFLRHAAPPCDVGASAKRFRTPEKVCAVFAQIDLCAAESACRSSANDGRPDGCWTAMRARASACMALLLQSQRTIACNAKCLFLCALRKHERCRRCNGIDRGARAGRRSAPPASDAPEARVKKNCPGLLTCRKTVIRFRPADDSCGIE